MDHDLEYTVTVRGEVFTLTKSQIEFDAPNYFTMCFLGDFREAQTRHVKLSRDPDLFRIILDYLCGYTVLPLSKTVIPARMTQAAALKNLRTDAAFYQLEGLIQECDIFIKPFQVKAAPVDPYLVLGSKYPNYYPNNINPSIVKQIPDALKGDCWHTYISEEKISKEPWTAMHKPESYNDYSGLRTLAAIEHFQRNMITGYTRNTWKLVGWLTEECIEAGLGGRHSKLLVVVEDLTLR